MILARSTADSNSNGKKYITIPLVTRHTIAQVFTRTKKGVDIYFKLVKETPECMA